VDENELRTGRFRASEDFVLAGRSASLGVPLDGQVRVTASLRKTAVTTDDLRVELRKSPPRDDDSDAEAPDEEVVVAARVVAHGATGTTNLDWPIEVSRGERLRIWVHTDSPIDLGSIDFSAGPRVTYQSATGSDGAAVTVVDDAGDPLIESALPFDMSLFTKAGWRLGDPWVAEGEGTLDLTCKAYGIGTFAIAAKSDGERIDKALVDGGEETTLEVPYTDGQEIFFTASPVGDN